MATYDGKIFVDQDVVLDGNVFDGCTFDRCVLFFLGGPRCSMKHCTFNDCNMGLGNEAAVADAAMQFLFDSQFGASFAPILDYIEGALDESEFKARLHEFPGKRYFLSPPFLSTIGHLAGLHRSALSRYFGVIDYAAESRASFSALKRAAECAGFAHRESTALYVYLPKPWMVKTWEAGGGPVPIKLASSFYRPERSAEFTPDETVNLRSNLAPEDVPWQYPTLGYSQLSGFEDCTDSNGNPLPTYWVEDSSRYDGAVMCFARSKSDFIAHRFNRSTCVRVDDIASLKEHLDAKIGSESQAGNCTYTTDHLRSCFQKSVEDAWQDEFRLYWPEQRKPIEVQLLPGSAVHEPISPFPFMGPDEAQRWGAVIAESILRIATTPVFRRPSN